MICVRCGEGVDEAVAFCQRCGTPVSALAGVSAPHSGAGSAALICSTCEVPNPPGTNFCCACGVRIGASASASSPPPAVKRDARLITVRRDGSDGPVFPIAGEQFDVGRTEGDLLFDDPHMAPRHARLTRIDGRYQLSPLESRNGVYVQVREPTEISDGDHVLLGRQVMRFEVPNEAEREPRPALEHGLVLFGTPMKPAWGRLRQLTSAGITRDVYHLSRAAVVLGREQGDIVFSDDEFLSRRHAQIQLHDGRVTLADLGSSNGTFVRLRGKHWLSPGALVRMGDELLRFELG